MNRKLRNFLLVALLAGAVTGPTLWWKYRRKSPAAIWNNYVAQTLSKRDVDLEAMVSAPPRQMPVESGPVVGQNFYTSNPTEDFTLRLSAWVRYLGVEDLFPSMEKMSSGAIEVSSEVRNAGDASFFGFADKKMGSVLIRPNDYATLLHEATHTNPEYEGKLLATEAGAFALEIFTTGDYDGCLELLTNSYHYSGKDKRRGRILAEASVVLGRAVFDYLKEAPADISEVEMVAQLKGIMGNCDTYYVDSNRTAMDYLVEAHCVTPYVADYLLGTTGDTKHTIIRSTSRMKRDVIGAFKTLVSFYSINMGYSLDEAIRKTEWHFRENEALSLHKTLMSGAKDVFAKMKEYGYDLRMSQGLCEMMLSRGATRARAYAEGLPCFLELTGQYGPKGRSIMEFAFRHPNFFDTMTLTDAAKELLELADSEPEQAGMILGELAAYDWDLPMVTPSRMDFTDAYERKMNIFKDLQPSEKAAMVALSAYASVLEREASKKLLGGEAYFGQSIPDNCDAINALMESSEATIFDLSVRVKKELKIEGTIPEGDSPAP